MCTWKEQRSAFLQMIARIIDILAIGLRQGGRKLKEESGVIIAQLP
jgi:hypothetical protein